MKSSLQLQVFSCLCNREDVVEERVLICFHFIEVSMYALYAILQILLVYMHMYEYVISILS